MFWYNNPMSTETQTADMQDRDADKPLGVRLGNAVLREDLPAVLRHLKDGADPNEVHLGWSTLAWAYARKVKPDIKKALLKGGGNPNAPQAGLWQTLVYHGHLTDARTLMKKYGYVEQKDDNGRPVSHFFLGRESMMGLATPKSCRMGELFFQAGMPWQIDRAGKPPTTFLHEALRQLLSRPDYKKQQAATEWVKMALCHGFDPNFFDEPSGLPPLVHAFYLPENAVSLLLDAGADPLLPSFDERPLIHRLVQTATLPLIRRVLEKGETLTRTDRHGDTALSLARPSLKIQPGWTDIMSLSEQNHFQTTFSTPDETATPTLPRVRL